MVSAGFDGEVPVWPGVYHEPGPRTAGLVCEGRTLDRPDTDMHTWDNIANTFSFLQKNMFLFYIISFHFFKKAISFFENESWFLLRMSLDSVNACFSERLRHTSAHTLRGAPSGYAHHRGQPRHLPLCAGLRHCRGTDHRRHPHVSNFRFMEWPDACLCEKWVILDYIFYFRWILMFLWNHSRNN